ncbi:MAG: hypothetical protein LBE95_01855, partial [Holosporaceae bacterium]|nr:hypothetical protein [Holosporaceae bacterium]
EERNTAWKALCNQVQSMWDLRDKGTNAILKGLLAEIDNTGTLNPAATVERRAISKAHCQYIMNLLSN